MTGIEIPEGVTKIEPETFSGCSALTSVVIPDNVTSLGDSVFGNCIKLKSVLLSSNITSISTSLFSGCSALTDIVLPDKVVTIKSNAFAYCTSLRSIEMPNTVQSIENYAFAYCNSMTSVVLPSTLQSIENYTFAYCNALTNVVLPNTLQTIKNYAFAYCTSLQNIVIPNGVTSIKSRAYYLDKNLKTNVYTNNTIAKTYSWTSDRRSVTVYPYEGNPDALLLKANKTTPASSVVVTINYPFYSTIKQYKIGTDGDWENYASPIVISANTTVYARTLDVNGFVIDSASLVISNIIEIIITISDYNREPTNKDITVTASTNIGILNATSHTFRENGSFDFIVTDENGKTAIETVTINNIDKIPPIITLSDYNTNPTNQDITITATTNEGLLNESCYVFSENGSFEFVAIDSAGNITKITVTIVNIDKVPPSKPFISVVENKLTIVSGTDRESGIKQTLYQLNNDNWKIYSEAVLLADGVYVISAKTIDIADNESSCDVYNVNIYINAVNEATNALIKAENTYLQADLDVAKVLINALPACPEKTELIVRADNLQKIIKDNNSIILTAASDEIPRTQIINFIMKASDISDLYTMQLEFRYDPERLELDQTNIKNLAWENDQNGYAAIKVDSSVGEISIIYSQKGDTQGVSGDSELVSLPFKTLQIGKTIVEVSKIKLMSSQGERIKVPDKTILYEINVLPNPMNIMVTGEKGQDEWYISPVTVEITDLDTKDIYYSIDGIKLNYTQPFSINEIGEHRLIVTAEDGRGYIKEEELVLKIDYDSPVISVGNQINDWKNRLIVIPECDDQDGSGILQRWYQWANTNEQPEQWEEYNGGEIIQTAENTWYLHVKALDVAGNVGKTVFGPYYIDGTAPVISVDYEKREAWGREEVIVTPDFFDEGGSQLKKMSYQWNQDQSPSLEYIPYISGGLQQKNDGIWYLHLIAEDGAGNLNTVTYGPYCVDTNAPVIEFLEISEGVNYTDSVTPEISIYDMGSGVKTISLQLDGEEYVSGTQITERGGHTITAVAEDFVGNSTVKSISFTIYTSTVLTLDVPQVEYSDVYTICATLTAGSQTVSGTAITVSGAAISIKLDGVDLGIHYTDSQGKVKLEGIALFKEGSYVVEAIYLPDPLDYFVSSQSQSSLTVLEKKNGLYYEEYHEISNLRKVAVKIWMSQDAISEKVSDGRRSNRSIDRRYSAYSGRDSFGVR